MKFIPIDKELDAFKEHLNINERTIFSAKFGDGKTFFLDIFKKNIKIIMNLLQYIRLTTK